MRDITSMSRVHTAHKPHANTHKARLAAAAGWHIYTSFDSVFVATRISRKRRPEVEKETTVCYSLEL